MKEDPVDYVHECYTVEAYLKAYTYGLEPINGEKMWPKGVGYPVKPPLVRTMPGRPKKKRKRGQDEPDPKNPTRLRKIGGVRMTCQRCLQPGHNTRGCKNEEVKKVEKEKGKRGRPRKHPIAAPTPQDSDDARRTVARERAQARRGIGVMYCEGTGNMYLSTGTTTTFIQPRQRGRPRANSAAGSSGATGEGDQGTQESVVE
ncbi:uncharacterized protein LOC130994951 [Salvia miltiorrhiza]|uniref:uncharacterized protein LOC130994951 n=1 Tax=Salvia miltiorrhiza TaxID=226208 RepID=UPI0025ACDEB4|nr:uncharacterized protein LOC130994951 [Salvia miltiorrhiza]